MVIRNYNFINCFLHRVRTSLQIPPYMFQWFCLQSSKEADKQTISCENINCPVAKAMTTGQIGASLRLQCLLGLTKLHIMCNMFYHTAVKSLNAAPPPVLKVFCLTIDFHIFSEHASSLQWRQNGRDSVSDPQPHDCLLTRLFRRRSKKTPKPRVTGLCAGNSRKNFHLMTSSCLLIANACMSMWRVGASFAW